MGNRWGGGRIPTHREPDRPPPLPFVPGEVGNGEFVPAAADGARPLDRRARRCAGPRTPPTASGMDRRRFLQTAGGMAAMLGAVNLAGRAAGGGSRPTPAGHHRRPDHHHDASTTGPAPSRCPTPEEIEACEQALGDQDEFIFDMHTHHVMPDGPWRQNAPAHRGHDPGARARRACTEADPLECLDRAPTCTTCSSPATRPSRCCPTCPTRAPDDAPVPFADKVGTARLRGVAGRRRRAPGARAQRDRAELRRRSSAARRAWTRRRHRHGRGVQGVHGVGSGRSGLRARRSRRSASRSIEQARDARGEGDLRAQGPAALRVRPALQRSRATSWPAARCSPTCSSSCTTAPSSATTTEGPYDPARADRGHQHAGQGDGRRTACPPNANVWAELGTTWREVHERPRPRPPTCSASC